MEQQGVRILSLEAKKIFEHIRKNGEEMGYELPAKKTFAYFSLFKNILDYSLDSIELENAYIKHNRRKFLFADQYNNTYTLAVINLKFSRGYIDEREQKSVKELREYFYEKGFNLDGTHYIRYKRSSGSSRQGKCLFIDENLYKHMQKWGECGLEASSDLASWEAYKSLSLSAIHGLIHIPLNNILIIPDCKSLFEEEVVSVEEKDGKLTAEKKIATIENNIWDGESLLDESLFKDEYANRHMLLLRNKFFKSCAFKTRLQKWFKDKNITSVDVLKDHGFITSATDIEQIKMVTTPSSLKFLKFMKGGLTERNVRTWMENVDEYFGVVKFDKRTKFFGGKMVQTSYQFLNTLALDEEQARNILAPSEQYIKLLRQDCDFMRYHFSDAYKRDLDGEMDEIADGLAERSDVIFKLMHVNYAFKDTTLYYNFRNNVVKAQKDRLKMGHILLSGTNATLFGNGPEMLLALSGEFDLKSVRNRSVILASGEIACARFSHGKELVCARSPHITMGNLYCVTNNLQHDIWDYFDLGENIVCVNAIRENIQQRLNGCDYDSDAMLITDDPIVVAVANEQKEKFCVPVCNIQSTLKQNQTLADLDYETSENRIGSIVNLSQKLNSILWNRLNSNEADSEEVETIYRDICILAVLSGIEIDKAKRAYSTVDVDAELLALSHRYDLPRPQFFKTLDQVNIERLVRNVFASDIEDPVLRKMVQKQRRAEYRKELQGKKHYQFYRTAMEYVHALAEKIDYREHKPKNVTHLRVVDILREPTANKNSTAYAQKHAIVKLCDKYRQELKKLYHDLHRADNEEQEVIYDMIQQKKAERDEKVLTLLTNEAVLYLILQHYEKNKVEDWQLYAPILKNPLFLSMLKESSEKLQRIVEDEQGTFVVYGKNYIKQL